jgi:hypothetical protein
MDRARIRKTAVRVLIIVAALTLFNHVMSFPMEFRNGCWKEWLGDGPAGKPSYRAYRFIDMEPVKESIPLKEQAEKDLSKAGVLSLNSPYGPSGTAGRPRNWFSNRPVIVAPLDSSVSYKVKLPKDSKLSFGMAVIEVPGQKIQNGTWFVVEFESSSGKQELFNGPFFSPDMPAFWENTKDRERFWHEYVWPPLKKRGNFKDVVVDLSSFLKKDEEGILTFKTDVYDDNPNDGPRTAYGLWSSPEIWAELPADQEPPVNVVLFMIEATPTTIIEPYTDRPGLHPNIKKFSDGAVVFDKFFTVGDSTNLSVYPFFTGRHYTSMGLPHEMYYLAPMVKARFYKRRFPTLAEAFTRAGYRTAAFGTNHYFVSTREFGLDLGFDQVEVLARRWYAHGDTMLATMEWLRQNADKPFFLYLHYDAPHDEEKPYIEDLLRAFTHRSRDRRWTYRKQMAQQIAVDRDFGRLLDALEVLGVRDRTLVIVTADHGNCLDPAREFAVLRADRDKPWRTPFQHGRAMGIEDIHIPFIIDWPIGKGENRRIKMQASSIDLFPTLVELLIPDPPPGLKERMEDIDGKSMAGLIKGDEDEPYPCKCPVYAISRGGDHLVTYGRYHYFKRSSGFQKILYPARGIVRHCRRSARA